MAVITGTQQLKFFIIISSLFAFMCRFLNGGFGLVIFFPIYLFVVIFHLITLFASIEANFPGKLLKRYVIASQLCFVCFFLLDADVADSTGGVTIFVVLEHLGIKGVKYPLTHLEFYILDLVLLCLVLLLDIAIIVISIRSHRLTRRMKKSTV